MDKILIVDDEMSIRESFSLILDGKHKIVTAASGEAALKHVSDQKIDLVYLDIRMPGIDGLETLKRIKEIDPAVDVVMVTAVNDVQKAGEAIRRGARDYIIKPFDVDAILKMTDSILLRKSQLIRGSAIQKEVHKTAPAIIGRNDKIESIIKTAKAVAPKNSRVLILGEAGTEKEAVAEFIHSISPRADLPLRSISLSGKMSPAGIESRLFGSGTGSTTADLERRPGLLEEVRGGTLFINHVEYLPPKPIATESRLIAGSSLADLAESSKEVFDLFSETLITLPPLRERLSDLPLLIEYFLEKFNEKHGKEVAELSPEAEELFSNYGWPGNTKELECVLERLVINASSQQITASDLPVDLLLKSSGAPGGEYLSQFEKSYIRKIVDEAGGDKEKAAAILQINPILIEGKL